MKSRTMKTSFWTTLTCSLGYLLLVLACLTQWRHQRPLLQLDYFSGGYLALRLLGSIYSLSSSRLVFHSSPVREQWWALDSDPAGPRWVMVLMALGPGTEIASHRIPGRRQLIEEKADGGVVPRWDPRPRGSAPPIHADDVTDLHCFPANLPTARRMP